MIFGVWEPSSSPARTCPALGGVYKLAAIDKGGVLQPKIKISENSWKITNPGYKKVVRIYGNSTGMAIADLIMLDDETIDPEKPLTIFPSPGNLEKDDPHEFPCEGIDGSCVPGWEAGVYFAQRYGNSAVCERGYGDLLG